jgi:hypothetical protein
MEIKSHYSGKTYELQPSIVHEILLTIQELIQKVKSPEFIITPDMIDLSPSDPVFRGGRYENEDQIPH